MQFLLGGGASRPAWLPGFSALMRPLGTFRWATPLVALVLLVAAVLKAHQLATEPVFGTSLLESRWLLVAVVQYELFLAFWLLSGLFPRTAWWFAIGTFGLFAVVSGAKALAGEPTCGCFGRVPTSPWLSLSINLAAILALMAARHSVVRSGMLAESIRPRDGTNAPYRQWLGMAWVVTGIGLAAVTVNQRASADMPGIGVRVGDFVLVEPERMLDGPFALGEHIDIGDRLATGRWLVVLYRLDCPTCQSLFEELTGIGSELKHRVQMAWICVGTPQRPDHSLVLAEPSLEWVSGAMSQRFDWFVSVPLFVVLDENRVVAASSALEGSFRDLVNGSWPKNLTR
jgi:hypothetical protein